MSLINNIYFLLNRFCVQLVFLCFMILYHFCATFIQPTSIDTHNHVIIYSSISWWMKSPFICIFSPPPPSVFPLKLFVPRGWSLMWGTKTARFTPHLASPTKKKAVEKLNATRAHLITRFAFNRIGLAAANYSNYCHQRRRGRGQFRAVLSKCCWGPRVRNFLVMSFFFYILLCFKIDIF